MFKFGKQKPDIKQYAIIGIVLSSLIAALSQCTGVSQDGLWDLLDEVQRKYFPQTILSLPESSLSSITASSHILAAAAFIFPNNEL